MPFKPGNPGGPGRPKGSRSKHHPTRLRALLDQHAEDVWTGIIEDAKKGDALCRKLVAERTICVRRSEPVVLPGWQFATTPEAKVRCVAEAVGNGVIDADRARDIAAMVQGQVSIEKAAEEREALNMLLEANGLPRLDPRPDSEQAA